MDPYRHWRRIAFAMSITFGSLAVLVVGAVLADVLIQVVHGLVTTVTAIAASASG